MLEEGDPESESRINSRTYLGQFGLVDTILFSDKQIAQLGGRLLRWLPSCLEEDGGWRAFITRVFPMSQCG